MNILNSLRTLALAGLAFTVTTTAFARDRGHSHSSHYSRGGHGSYGYRGGYYAPRPYFAPSYGYRGHYGRPAYFGGPSISVGFVSTPTYYRSPAYYDSYPTRTVYRGVAVRSYRDSARYDDDLAVDVQRALARRGFYRGSIDGDVGPGTRAAIRSYQYDRRLEVTGRIDNSLLRSLGLS